MNKTLATAFAAVSLTFISAGAVSAADPVTRTEEPDLRNGVK
ncbi:DUF992 domain-containing protein, partial [Pseudomonas sp. BGM005]|nr:DUF992 domain-containing protein [Pseudomonas sp. BG5]